MISISHFFRNLFTLHKKSDGITVNPLTPQKSKADLAAEKLRGIINTINTNPDRFYINSSFKLRPTRFKILFWTIKSSKSDEIKASALIQKLDTLRSETIGAKIFKNEVQNGIIVRTETNNEVTENELKNFKTYSNALEKITKEKKDSSVFSNLSHLELLRCWI